MHQGSSPCEDISGSARTCCSQSLRLLRPRVLHSGSAMREGGLMFSCPRSGSRGGIAASSYCTNGFWKPSHRLFPPISRSRGALRVPHGSNTGGRVGVFPGCFLI